MIRAAVHAIPPLRLASCQRPVVRQVSTSRIIFTVNSLLRNRVGVTTNRVLFRAISIPVTPKTNLTPGPGTTECARKALSDAAQRSRVALEDAMTAAIKGGTTSQSWGVSEQVARGEDLAAQVRIIKKHLVAM